MPESLQLIHNYTEGELPEGKIIEASTAQRTVCLLKRNGIIHAFAPTCPHSGARFCDGWLDPRGHVVCPLHKYKFDPQNGRNTSGEGYKLRTFPVTVKEGLIYITLI